MFLISDKVVLRLLIRNDCFLRCSVKVYEHSAIVNCENLGAIGEDKHATTVLLALEQRSIVDGRRVT